MKEKRKQQIQVYEYLPSVLTKLDLILRTIEEQKAQLIQNYEKQISDLEGVINQKNKQIQNIKGKAQRQQRERERQREREKQKQKNTTVTPIKILLKNQNKTSQKKLRQVSLDKCQIQMRTQLNDLSSSITPESFTKTRPSLDVCISQKEFIVNSDKKDTRGSKSKLKNNPISQPRVSLNNLKCEPLLVQFSTNILKQVKEKEKNTIKINKKTEITKLKSPRFIRMQKQKLTQMSTTSVQNNKSIQNNRQSNFLKKKKSSNNLLRESKDKENSTTLIMGNKKIQRKSNSKKNLLGRKRTTDNEDYHSKKCIDVTIPVKFINVAESQKGNV